MLQPLKGEIDPEKSDFSVGKVKVEVRFVKRVPVRWSELVGEEPDSKCLSSDLDLGLEK